MLRFRSALLSLEGIPEEATVDGPPVLRMEILTSLASIGIPQEQIDGIECMSKHTWYVVFIKEADRNESLGKSIDLHEKSFVLSDPNPQRQQARYTRVRVYGYPLDSDSSYLEKVMSYYGDLSHMNDIIDRNCDLKTGVKELAYRSLNQDIPSYIYAGRHQIRCQYYGQQKTCRKCHKPGHIAKDCQAGSVCKVCGEPDHKKKNCPNQRCYHCNETGHLEALCPKHLENFPKLGQDKGKEVSGSTSTTGEDSERRSTDWNGSGGPFAYNSDAERDLVPTQTENPTIMDTTKTITNVPITTETQEATDTTKQSKDPEDTDDEEKTPDDKEMAEVRANQKRGLDIPVGIQKGKNKGKTKRVRHSAISAGRNRNPFLKK